MTVLMGERPEDIATFDFGGQRFELHHVRLAFEGATLDQADEDWMITAVTHFWL
jgi:hypothetical protein